MNMQENTAESVRPNHQIDGLYPAHLQENKQAILTVLRKTDIATVLIDFDGSDDEGGVNQPAAYTRNNEARGLPASAVTWRRCNRQSETIQVPIEQALVCLAHAYLKLLHGHWKSGEGAYGEITIDVAEGKGLLDYNERFMDECNFLEAF
jgi:hypothetical protein